MQFGCILSSYDSRDYKLKAGVAKNSLPDTFTCQLKTEVKNQKRVCSCVAHAMSSILEHHAEPSTKLSTNFIYGIRKKLFNSDGYGMSLRDACKIAADYGDMLLDDCQGNNEVPDCQTIAAEAFLDQDKLNRAKDYRISKYFLCLSSNDIKYALVNYGPVLASLKWYNSWNISKDGQITGDSRGKFGYHAVVIYGYDKDGFWCQNSWGKSWGKSGKFFVPNSIKFAEARGIVDWNGTDELKEPNPDGLLNLLYKGLNAFVNLIKKLIKK